MVHKVYVGWIYDKDFEDFAEFKIHKNLKIVTNAIDKWVVNDVENRYVPGYMQLEIPVKKIETRQCNSRGRHPDRWTRSELVKEAEKRGITQISKKNMNQLCKEMNLYL